MAVPCKIGKVHSWKQGSLSYWCEHCWVVRPGHHPEARPSGRSSEDCSCQIPGARDCPAHPRVPSLCVCHLPREERPWGKKQCPVHLPGSGTSARKLAFIFLRDGYLCHYCKRDLRTEGIFPTVDHRISRKNGGGGEHANLVAACGPCNHKKSDMNEDEFLASARLRQHLKGLATVERKKLRMSESGN